MEKVITLAITFFFLYHLARWAMGFRVVQIIGVLVAGGLGYHFLQNGMPIETWVLIVGIAALVVTIKPKKKKAGKAKAKASR